MTRCEKCGKQMEITHKVGNPFKNKTVKRIECKRCGNSAWITDKRVRRN